MASKPNFCFAAAWRAGCSRASSSRRTWISRSPIRLPRQSHSQRLSKSLFRCRSKHPSKHPSRSPACDSRCIGIQRQSLHAAFGFVPMRKWLQPPLLDTLHEARAGRRHIAQHGVGVVESVKQMAVVKKARIIELGSKNGQTFSLPQGKWQRRASLRPEPCAGLRVYAFTRGGSLFHLCF